MKEEIMNDAIDDAMEDEGDEEERYQAFFYVYTRILCINRYIVIESSNVDSKKSLDKIH